MVFGTWYRTTNKSPVGKPGADHEIQREIFLTSIEHLSPISNHYLPSGIMSSLGSGFRDWAVNPRVGC